MTLSSYRILIVDDNPSFVKALELLIRSILGPKVLQLDIAYNGAEAVEKVYSFNQQYNYIFMDVNMPQMDGITATKMINKDFYRYTKIIAVSFNTEFSVLDEMIHSGAVQYIHKDKLTYEVLEKVFEV